MSRRRSILLTGFPGFLGARLLGDLLDRDVSARATCLVQPRYMGVARAHLRSSGSLDGRVELIEGDITLAGLGVDDLEALMRRQRRSSISLPSTT